MKRFVLAAAALIGAASGAAAADLRGTLPAQALAPVPAVTWSGFYVGAHAGYTWSDSDMTLTNVGVAVLPIDVANGTLPRKLSYDLEGAMGGVQAGYNIQHGMIVAGIEADVSWMDGEADAVYSAPDLFLFPGALTNTVVRSEVQWLGTARGRLGLAIDRALFFVTGGAAAGHVKNTFSINIPAAPMPGGYVSPKWPKSDTEWGWVLGAGIEYALTDNVSLKAEYLHYDLKDHTIRGTDGPVFPGEFIDYKFKNNGNLVRGGANVRF